MAGRRGRRRGRGADFPDAVLETIFSKIPFPEIVNVRLLSKQWRTNFPRVTKEVSAKWPLYYPVVVDGSKLLGYDSVENCLKCVKTATVGPSWWKFDSEVARSGFWMVLMTKSQDDRSLRATLRNIFTRKRRKREDLASERATMNFDGDDEFELFVCVVRQTRPQTLRVDVRKSFSGVWKRRIFKIRGICELSYPLSRCGAFMDGSVYYISNDDFES